MTKFALIIFVSDLKLSKPANSCSVCAWTISEYHFPPLMLWTIIGLIWFVLQFTINKVHEIHHSFKMFSNIR